MFFVIKVIIPKISVLVDLTPMVTASAVLILVEQLLFIRNTTEKGSKCTNLAWLY